ncbi:hypothetical protein O0L34_g5112 [Tuta absoluta]|nr:hypothetical protein O0L34_g5112 [Tuta absoluta]
MLLPIVVVLVVSRAGAQEQALSTVPPAPPQPYPLLDLFTGASNYYPDIRKTYDSHTVCPKSDGLSSTANFLGSIAKILMSVTVLLFFKLLVGKLLLFPLSLVLFAKLGLKTFLLWPMILKMAKYFKKKKKKAYKGRSGVDCSERIACVVQQASRNGWSSHLGAAATFTWIEDVEEDGPLAKILLTMLSGDNVAKCMSLECTSGINIS